MNSVKLVQWIARAVGVLLLLLFFLLFANLQQRLSDLRERNPRPATTSTR